MSVLDDESDAAKTASTFTTGWRPAMGWVFVFGMAATLLVYPAFQYFAQVKGWPAPPKPELEELFFLLSGGLGLGGIRMVERLKGKS